MSHPSRSLENSRPYTARTLEMNCDMLSFRADAWVLTACAESLTFFVDLPVPSAIRATSVIRSVTTSVEVETSWVLREISLVADDCSSIAAAIDDTIELTELTVVATARTVSTARFVAS
jgi:hypothetical protein